MSYSRLQLAPVMSPVGGVSGPGTDAGVQAGVGPRFAADAEQRRRCRLHVALLAQIQQPVLIGAIGLRGRSVMSKSPSAIGATKLTVRATGSPVRSGWISMAFNSAAAVILPNGPTMLAHLGMGVPAHGVGRDRIDCTAWSNGCMRGFSHRGRGR